MSKTYEIFSKENYEVFNHKMVEYFKMREARGLPFQKLTVVVKRYQKPKSSEQHRKYWKLIGLLTELFIDAGYEVNQDDIHNFIKVKANFIKIVDGVIFPKSISDKSDEATSANLNMLIEFIYRFTVENFDTDLGEERNVFV